MGKIDLCTKSQCVIFLIYEHYKNILILKINYEETFSCVEQKPYTPFFSLYFIRKKKKENKNKRKEARLKSSGWGIATRMGSHKSATLEHY